MARSPIILIVDDSEVTLEVLRARLTQAGVSVVCASSVKDALAFDAETITSAIVDVDLGEDVDGISLADVLAGRNPRLRLAMFTGHEGAKRTSPRMTFRKPHDVDRLIAWALEG